MKKTAEKAPVTITRERWLTNLAEALNTAIFNDGMPKYRITCGFPSRGGLGKVKQVIGQCWNPSASEDSTTEIIMTITESDTMLIAATVAHEMIHAIVGTEAGHKKPFRDLAIEIGLEGKMTATVAGEKFKEAAEPILKALGDYPHAALNGNTLKKQSTRNLKAVCNQCGYVVRTSRKWLEQGAPLCGLHDQPVQMKVV